MSQATDILRSARFKGVREVKAKLSRYMREKAPTCITERGQPKSVLIPYQTLLQVTHELEDLQDMVEELKDEHLLAKILRARRDYRNGKAIPAENLFKKLGY